MAWEEHSDSFLVGHFFTYVMNVSNWQILFMISLKQNLDVKKIKGTFRSVLDVGRNSLLTL